MLQQSLAHGLAARLPLPKFEIVDEGTVALRLGNSTLNKEQFQTSDYYAPYGVIIPLAWLKRPIVSADRKSYKALGLRIQSYQPAGEHDVVTQVRRATRVGC